MNLQLNLTIMILLTSLFACKNRGDSISSYGYSDDVAKINGTFQYTRPARGKPACTASAIPDTQSIANLEDLINFNQATSCKTLCPKHSIVLPRLKNSEKDMGFLAFKNMGRGGIGRCRGHSILSQKFNMLGLYCDYKLENKLKDWCQEEKNKNNINCTRIKFCNADPLYQKYKTCSPYNLSKECKRFYEKVIEDISRENIKWGFPRKTSSPVGIMRAIPGFRSLAEFSSHPEFVSKFKAIVKRTPSTYSALNSNIPRVAGSRNVDVFESLITRVKNKQVPYLAIKGIIGSGLGAHAVTTYKVKGWGNKRILCIRDPNLVPKIKIDQRAQKPIVKNDCSNFIKMNGNQPVYVKEGKQIYLSKFEIHSDEDLRTSHYADEYRNICERIKKNENLCNSNGVDNRRHIQVPSGNI